jgi:hypothetical protein
MVATSARAFPAKLLAQHRQPLPLGVVNRNRFLPSRSSRARFTVFRYAT